MTSPPSILHDMTDTLELDHLPIPAESTGLCLACRQDMALPESEFCEACEEELFGDAA